jgi:hypothetical protein
MILSLAEFLPIIIPVASEIPKETGQENKFKTVGAGVIIVTEFLNRLSSEY